MSNSITIHHVFSASLEVVYNAYLNPDAMAKWLPPHGFIAKIHHHEAREGGTYRMTFVEIATGVENSFGGKYLELIPNKLIRSTDIFDDPNLVGEMEVTVEFTQVSLGTELKIVQRGIPDVIPLDACYIGWQQSMALLALLVNT